MFFPLRLITSSYTIYCLLARRQVTVEVIFWSTYVDFCTRSNVHQPTIFQLLLLHASPRPAKKNPNKQKNTQKLSVLKEPFYLAHKFYVTIQMKLSTISGTPAGKTQRECWSHLKVRRAVEADRMLSLELSAGSLSWNRYMVLLRTAWTSSWHRRRRWVKLLEWFLRVPRPRTQLIKQKLPHLSRPSLRIHIASSTSMHLNSYEQVYSQILQASLENAICHKHWQFFEMFTFSLSLYFVF